MGKPLNYLGDQHGSLWWGGYLSTEHTAYLNLKNGIPAEYAHRLDTHDRNVYGDVYCRDGQHGIQQP